MERPSTNAMTYEEIRETWASMKEFDRMMYSMQSESNKIEESYATLEGVDVVEHDYKALVDNETKIHSYIRDYCRLERDIIDAIGEAVLVIGDDKVIFVDSNGELVERDLVRE